MANSNSIERELENIYQLTLNQLSQGKRPQLLLSGPQLDFLYATWRQELDAHSPAKNFQSNLFTTLCLLQYNRKQNRRFQSLLIETLNKSTSAKLLTTLLGLSTKLVIDSCTINSLPLPQKYLNTLLELSKHPDGEVFEWVIRCLAQTGPQGVKLVRELKQRKYGLKTIFSSHRREGIKILTEL